MNIPVLWLSWPSWADFEPPHDGSGGSLGPGEESCGTTSFHRSFDQRYFETKDVKGAAFRTCRVPGVVLDV